MRFKVTSSLTVERNTFGAKVNAHFADKLGNVIAAVGSNLEQYKTSVDGLYFAAEGVAGARSPLYQEVLGSEFGKQLLMNIKTAFEASERKLPYDSVMANRSREQYSIFQKVLMGQQPAEFPEDTQDIILDKSWTGNLTEYSQPHVNVLTFPASKRNMWKRALESGAACVFGDNEDAQSPLPRHSLESYRNVIEVLSHTLKNCRNEMMSEKHGDAYIRYQATHMGSSVYIDTKDGLKMVPGGFVDLMAHVTAMQLLQREDKLAVRPLVQGYIPKLQFRPEAGLWMNWINQASKVTGVDVKQFLVKWLVETWISTMDLNGINRSLSKSIKGTNDGRYDWMFHFLNMLTPSRADQIAVVNETMNSPAFRGKTPEQQKLILETLAERFAKYRLPDAKHMNMGVSPLANYAEHTSEHNRRPGLNAEGGMMVQTPSLENPAAIRKALVARLGKIDENQMEELVAKTREANIAKNKANREKLYIDKLKEALLGKSGAWAGHTWAVKDVGEPFRLVATILSGLKLGGALIAPRVREWIQDNIREIYDMPRADAKKALKSFCLNLQMLNTKEPSSEQLYVELPTEKSDLAAAVSAGTDNNPFAEQFADSFIQIMNIKIPGFLESGDQLANIILNLLKPIDQMSIRTAEDITAVDPQVQTPDKFTEEGVKKAMLVAMMYGTNWLLGEGCIALEPTLKAFNDPYNLDKGCFEDRATMEHARCWLKQLLALQLPIKTETGDYEFFTPKLFESYLQEVVDSVNARMVEFPPRNEAGKDPVFDFPTILGKSEVEVSLAVVGLTQKLVAALAITDKFVGYWDDVAATFLTAQTRIDAKLWNMEEARVLRELDIDRESEFPAAYLDARNGLYQKWIAAVAD